MRCPKCNEEISGSCRFCPKCGNALPMTLKCPECGTENIPAVARFCPSCGFEITKKAINGNHTLKILGYEGFVFLSSVKIFINGIEYGTVKRKDVMILKNMRENDIVSGKMVSWSMGPAFIMRNNDAILKIKINRWTGNAKFEVIKC